VVPPYLHKNATHNDHIDNIDMVFLDNGRNPVDFLYLRFPIGFLLTIRKTSSLGFPLFVTR